MYMLKEYHMCIQYITNPYMCLTNTKCLRNLFDYLDHVCFSFRMFSSKLVIKYKEALKHIADV